MAQKFNLTPKEQVLFKQSPVEVRAYVDAEKDLVFLDVPSFYYPFLVIWGYKKTIIFESEELLPNLPFMKLGTIFTEIFPLYEDGPNCDLTMDLVPILVKVNIEEKLIPEEFLTQKN